MKQKLHPLNKPDFINGLGDSSRATIELGVIAVDNDPILFREVLDLSFTKPYPVNIRTARVVELCCAQTPQLILPFMDEVIENISTSTTDGVKRCYLKIINDYTGIDGIDDPGQLLQICIDWLMSPKEAISIRHHALGVLLKICKKIPEIAPEIKSGIQFILEEGASAGLANTCHKALKELERISKRVAIASA